MRYEFNPNFDQVEKPFFVWAKYENVLEKANLFIDLNKQLDDLEIILVYFEQTANKNLQSQTKEMTSEVLHFDYNHTNALLITKTPAEYFRENIMWYWRQSIQLEATRCESDAFNSIFHLLKKVCFQPSK